MNIRYLLPLFYYKINSFTESLCNKLRHTFWYDAFLLITSFFFFYFSYFYLFDFLEGNNLFAYNKYFLLDFIGRPGGLLKYSSAFVLQFFSIPAVGAGILSFLLWACYRLYLGILKHITGTFLPCIALLPLLALSFLMDVSPVIIDVLIGLLLSLLSIYILSFCKRKWAFISCLISTGVLIYYIAAGLSVYWLLFLFVFFFNRSGKRWQDALGFWLIGLAAVLGSAWASYSFNDILAFSDLFMMLPIGLVPDTEGYTYLVFNKTSILYVSFFLVLFSSAVLIPLRKKAFFLYGANRSFILFILMTLLSFNYSKNEELNEDVKLEYYTKYGQWDELLKTCYSFFKKGHPDKDVNARYALYAKQGLVVSHRLNSEYFLWVRFPQMAPLFHDDFTMRQTEMMLLIPMLDSLGMDQKVFHTLANDVTYPNMSSKKIIRQQRNYAKINYDSIGVHNRRYLASTLFYRNVRFPSDREYFMQSQEVLSMDMGVLDAAILRKAYFEPENCLANEYAICFSLLNKNISGVYESLPTLRKYGYTELPRHIEEAVLIYTSALIKLGVLKEDDPEVLNPKGFAIRQETIAKMDAYMKNLELLQEGILAQKIFIKEFGGTYWYYFMFANPSWLQDNSFAG